MEFLQADQIKNNTVMKKYNIFSVPKLKLEKIDADLTKIITPYYIKLRIRAIYTLWGLIAKYNEISKDHINSVKIDEYVLLAISNMVGDLIQSFKDFVQQHFTDLLAEYFGNITHDIQTVQNSIKQVLDNEKDTIELQNEYKTNVNDSFTKMNQILAQIEFIGQKYSTLDFKDTNSD